MTRTVVHFAEGTTFGGAEQVLLTILAGLDRRRWQPLLAYHPAPGLAPMLECAQQLDIRVWPMPPIEDRHALQRVPLLVRALRAVRPAVFHAHLNWPLACRYQLVAAALARVPAVVATEHLFQDVPWRRSRLVQRVVALGVDRYITVSHDLARRIQDTFRFPAHKIAVVHNGIPLAPFAQPADAAVRAQLFGVTERPVVLTVARLHEQKGIQFLLEAARLLPDALFAIAGDGPHRPVFEAQAHALGVHNRVRFLGYREDVAVLLANCDLFVLPSQQEGLPLGVLEAMASGKPVIATAVGGTGEAVVDGDTGVLVPPADPAALAHAIGTLLRNPALAQRLAARGRACVQQEFSAETMVGRITTIYDQLLRAREVPHA